MTRDQLERFARILWPFAPHFADELGSKLGVKGGLNGGFYASAWPSHDAALLVDDEVEMPVQIQGKIKARLMVPTKADAAAVDYPVRLPTHPDGWRANSGSRTGIDGGRTVPGSKDKQRAVATRVGYIAPSKMYVSLTQSNADETALVASIQKDVYPSGTEDVDGVTWIVYQGGEGTEPVWTTRIDGPKGPTQLAITGAGSSDDFRALAIATQTQPPLG